MECSCSSSLSCPFESEVLTKTRVTSPLKLPPISFSSWNLFESCEWKWKLNYVDGQRRQEKGVYMDFGTALHGVIEISVCREPLIVDTDVAVFLFKKALLWLHQQHLSSYREKDQRVNLEELFSAGERILRRFGECEELAKAEVLYNEYSLRQPIDRTDDVQVDFKGYIDMVIKTRDARGNTILYVCDFKTCSFGWDAEKRRDKQLHFQILLYKHFLCKKFGLDPKFVRTAFVLLKRRPPKDKNTGQPICPVEFFPVSAGPVSVQRPLDRLNSSVTRMAEKVRSGVFKKNRNACTSPYGDECPYKNSTACPND